MFVAAFTALILFAGPQSAPPAAMPQASPPAPATAAATAPEPELICRRQPSEGSRRREQVCHTQADWDAIRRNARANRDQASSNQRQY